VHPQLTKFPFLNHHEQSTSSLTEGQSEHLAASAGCAPNRS